MNKLFYDSLRTTLYPNGVAVMASVTIDAVIAQASSRNVGLYDLAYMLATAYHEVGPAMLPKRESLNYSCEALVASFGRARISAADARKLGRKVGEPALSIERQRQIANKIYGGEWGRKNLGNIGPDDGWIYRGGGLPQTTGRANFAKVATLTGVDLVGNPTLITRVDIAVLALVVCMIHGTYTGKKLSDYDLPAQFVQARAIINNDVQKNGERIAGHARAFVKALEAGGYVPGMAVQRHKAAPLALVGVPAEAASDEIPVMAEKTKPASASTLTAGGGLAAAVLLAIYQLHDAITAKSCAWLSLFCGG